MSVINEEQLFSGLNPRQREAAKHTKGALLILAGAGAGKTKTIAHRISHLVHTGVSPSNILAITFTNKASQEMKERILAMLAKDPDLNRPVSLGEVPFVSTFHALGVHILREKHELAGVSRSFTILDRDDQKKMIREATTTVGYDTKEWEPSKVINAISRSKGNFITAEGFREKSEGSFFDDVIGNIWDKYEKLLKENNSLDFDDLLLKTALLLKRDEVREYYARVWTHIHIDEYQDTNKVQYEIARLLSSQTGNLCVVGDIDQNIYSWRGAELKNILNFEKDFPGATTILLEQNYRSTQTILTAANQIIQKNVWRKEKNLFTENGEGEKISLYAALNEGDEARSVAGKAGDLIKSGVDSSQIAVLYRANFQSRILEEAFLGYEIPYKLIGTRFFERAEVKDVLSYIRASLNPSSKPDIARIINSPVRGIGKTTLLRIFDNSLGDASPAIRAKVGSFYQLLERIAGFAKTNTPSKTVKFVLKETGLFDSLNTDKEEDRERLGNVEELATLAMRYDSLSPEEGIDRLLTDAALASDQDNIKENQNGVRLMTVHASKGLEFEYIFIVGLEDGLFPSDRGNVNPKSEEGEEERRLFYVALTRAKKKVFLSYAHSRTIFGSPQLNAPSEFIYDIDDELMERDGDEGGEPLVKIEF